MSEIDVRLSGVTKDYAMGAVTVHALRGIDLEIARGTLLVVLGPSGCGKTTTLNLMGALDRPTGGSVVVHGQEISHGNDASLTRFRRESIGFVFQFFNLIPTLSAAENVEMALVLRSRPRAARAEARRFLELVGLADRANHFPSELSGGEQQRVAIARALANRPAVLLCDEPTGNLDLETGVQVLSAIRDLNRSEGTTVVLVTHNVAVAPAADRVVRLRSGSIEKDERVAAPVDMRLVTW